jgi:hypothetical protein
MLVAGALFLLVLLDALLLALVVHQFLALAQRVTELTDTLATILTTRGPR